MHVDQAHAELGRLLVLRIGPNTDAIAGAALRCSQASGLPALSSPASRCSTETVW